MTLSSEPAAHVVAVPENRTARDVDARRPAMAGSGGRARRRRGAARRGLAGGRSMLRREITRW